MHHLKQQTYFSFHPISLTDTLDSNDIFIYMSTQFCRDDREIKLDTNLGMSNVESTQAPLDRGKVRVIAKSRNNT